MRPTLFIIAGPNGAGKSLFSKGFVEKDIEVFDGDKCITELRQRYPETGSDALQNYVNDNQFKQAKQTAITNGSDFAFETNFSADDPLETLHQFKGRGYKSHLIYFGMATLEECIQRVSQRVKNGGHKVAEASIRYNFEHGFKNLLRCWDAFDEISFFDNSIVVASEEKKIEMPMEFAHTKKGKLASKSDIYPAWFNPLITVIEP